MRISINIPWHQYALIIALAERMQEKSLWFGKTALQKLVYLLEAIYNVPCGYQFTLYIHGPFCADLISDLDYVDSLQGVNVQFDPSSNGYKINPGDSGEVLKEKAREFLNNYEGPINDIIEQFGSMRTRDLELRSTIVYVDRDTRISGRNLGRKEFIKEIKGIKPHFSEVEIEGALAELEQKGYVYGRD